MDNFINDTFFWLYSMNGSIVNIAGFALVWPVVFVFAMPVMIVLGAIKGFDLVVSHFNELDAIRGAPLRILDAINPRRWRSRAAARGSEAPSP